MILISKTYSEMTPESAEDGEYSYSGFVWEDCEYSFRELVELLRECSEASCWPATGSVNEWYCNEWGTTDYSTGEQRQECVHYSHKNPSKNAKYWRWAAKAAGLVK